MGITPLGDSALIVRVCENSSEPDAQSLDAVLEALHKIRNANIPGIVELAPAYGTIGVFFDPRHVAAAGVKDGAIFDFFTEQIQTAVSQRKKRGEKETRRSVEIPVCFDSEFALDLEEIAEHTGLSHVEIVDLYCGPKYCVNCIGFTPGFPYLSGLPQKLAIPRRDVPRKEIPAGSVAIGGKQTGIYPVKSPGGWHVIGRTRLRLFDPAKDPPALLRAGDRVQFRQITRQEFAVLQQ